MTEEFEALLRELAHAPPAPRTLPAPGEYLGRYRLDAPLGRGGMGRVYRAFDTELMRPVALKVLLATSERKEAILREARSAAAVRHPHVVTIYDAGEHEGLTFLAMELLEGPTLRARLREGSLPEADAVRVAKDVAAAIAAAHRAAIVHRDLKPDNVGFDLQGRAHVLDFGIAISGRGDAAGPAGTPHYMAPELEHGSKPSPRSDVFAFGVMLQEMLRGPADASDGTSADPSRLERLVQDCLRENPGERPPDGEALLRRLEAIERAPTGQGRAAFAWAVVVAVVLGGVLLRTLASLFPSSPPPDLLQLTHNSRAAPVLQARLSPEGDRLLFQERRGLFVMDLPDGEPRRVAERNPGHSLTWHPDNEKLVSFEDDRVSYIYLDGRRETVEGAESPDGKLLAQASLSPDAALLAFTSTSGLRSRPLRGGTPRWLMRPRGGVLPLSPPMWSPDGRAVAWTYVDLSEAERVAKISVVDMASGRDYLVATGPRLWLSSGVGPLAWRDDRRLLYVLSARIPAVPRDGVYEARWTEDGAFEHRRLFEAPFGQIGALSASVDGTRLALVLFEHTHDVLLGEVEGADPVLMRPFTFSDRAELPSAWARDGRGLWITARDETGMRVVRRDLDGATRALELSGSINTWPTPSPTGEALLYFSVGDELRLMRMTPDGKEAPLRTIEGWRRSTETVAPPRMLQLKCARSVSRCVLARAQGEHMVFETFNPKTGLVGESFLVPSTNPSPRFDVSGDGRILAVADVLGLEVRNEVGDLLDSRPPPRGCRLHYPAWSADGSGAYATAGCRIRDEASYQLIYFDLTEGSAEPPRVLVEREDAWLHHPVVSPDGRHVAVAAMVFGGDAYLVQLPE